MHKWYIEEYIIPKFFRNYLIAINLVFFLTFIFSIIGVDILSIKYSSAILSGLIVLSSFNTLLFVKKIRGRRQLSLLNSALIIVWIFHEFFYQNPLFLLFLINSILFIYIRFFLYQLYSWENQLWLLNGEKKFRTFYNSILLLKRDDISLLRYFPFSVEPVILLNEYEQIHGRTKGYFLFTVFQTGIIIITGLCQIILGYHLVLVIALLLFLLNSLSGFRYSAKAHF